MLSLYYKKNKILPYVWELLVSYFDSYEHAERMVQYREILTGPVTDIFLKNEVLILVSCVVCTGHLCGECQCSLDWCKSSLTFSYTLEIQYANLTQ